MSGIHTFSARVIDYAERLSRIADAAEGKRPQEGGRTRWIVLPATGAALYALVKSDFFSRRAKGVAREAKTLASELPDELMGRVQEASGTASGGNGASRSRSTSGSSSRRSTSSRSRAGTSSSRKKSTAR